MLLKDVKILTWTEAQFQTHSQIKGIDGSSFIFNRVQRKAMAKGCETHLTYWYWWYMHCSFLCSLTSSLQNCKCLESWRHFFQRCCKTEKALESGKLGFAFWLFHLPVMTFLVSSSVNWIQSLCWMSFFPFLLLLSLASGADLKDLNVVLSLWLLVTFNHWVLEVEWQREVHKECFTGSRGLVYFGTWKVCTSTTTLSLSLNLATTPSSHGLPWWLRL